MKNNLHFLLLVFLLSSTCGLLGQTDSTGFDGDHLNLHAVLGLFKESVDIESFEKSLNTESTKVNNLDLNRDGLVDFIFVKEVAEGESRTLVLRVEISESEMQDVAAIAIERHSDEDITLQIFGEEEVYGSPLMFEPSEVTKPATGGKGSVVSYEDQVYLGCGVCAWRSVQFLYMPIYRPHARPARWSLYQEWWMRWHAIQWHSYSNQCNPWGIYFYPSTRIACTRAHGLWRKQYVGCSTVHNRYAIVKKNHVSTPKGEHKDNSGQRKATPKVEKDTSSKKGNSSKVTQPSPQPKGPKANNTSKGTKPSSGKNQSKSNKPSMKPTQSGRKK